RIVAEKLGKRECIAICSFGEGTFNKIYLLTMEDGFQCIARLALPAFRRYKTESEVATMQYVAENTSIRVPKVYAWDSDPDNAIGAEYILMEKMNGVPLSEKWDHLAFEEKKHIINQVIDIMLQLLDTSFDRIGSLYMDENDSTYRIGPIISDLFFDGKRGTMDLERGPWGSTSEYLTAVIRAE
ncbi:Phosphotransferase enzyme, partial [Lunasporangiospora selenospora]